VSGTVVFRNAGPSTAAGLTYTLTLASGLSGVSIGNLPAGAATAYASGTGMVTFMGMPAALASGAMASGNGTSGITVSYTQPASAASIVTSAITTTTSQGSNSAPDNATVSTGGALIADVTTILSFPTSVNAGEAVSGTVVFRNAGPSTATGLTYTLALARGLSGVVISNVPTGATAAYTSATGVVIFTGMPATLVSGTMASGNGTSGITVAYTQPASAWSTVTSAITTTTSQATNSAPDYATVFTGGALIADVTTTLSFPGSVNAGETVSGTVLFRNAGPSIASGLTYSLTLAPQLANVVIANVPPGSAATYAPLFGVVTFTGMPATLAGGAMASGNGTSGITVSYTQNSVASSTVSSTMGTNTSQGANAAADNATTTVGGALVADVTTTLSFPASVNAGETVSGTVVFRNAGPSIASGLTYTLTLASGLSGVTVGNLPAGAATSYASGTGMVTFTGMPATLASGAMASGNGTSGLTVAYTQTTTANSTITSTIASSTGQGANSAVDNATTTVGGALVADVTTTLSFPASVNAGETVSGTVVFRNAGPSTAAGLAYTLTLASGLSGVRIGNLPAGATTSYASGTGAVTFTGMPATLASGAMASGNGTSGITVSYPQPASATSIVTSAITTTTSQRTNSAPDNATVTTGGALIADVTTTLSFPATVNAGEAVSGTVVFRNIGPSSAAGLTYTLTLSPGLGTVRIGNLPAGATTSYASGTGVVTCTGMPAMLASGAMASGNGTSGITVSYTQPASAASLVTSAITTTTSQGSNSAPDNATVSTGGALVADVATTLSFPASVNAGETVRGTVLFRNAGPSTASGLTYTLTLTRGLSNVVVGNLPTGAAASYALGTGVVTFTGMPATLAAGVMASGNGTSGLTLSYVQPGSGTSAVQSAIGTGTSQGSNGTPDSASSTVTGALVADVSTTLAFPTSINADDAGGGTVVVRNGRPVFVVPIRGTVLFQNAGPSVANGVSYTITIPTAATDVVLGNLPPNAIATYSPTTGAVLFTDMPSTLPSNSIASGNGTGGITLSYTQYGVAQSVVSSTIRTATNQGANTAPDQASISIAINEPPIADVTTTVSGLAASVAPGAMVTVRVEYRNAGPATSTGTTYGLALSPNLTGTAFSNLPTGATAQYDAVTGLVTFSGMPSTVSSETIVSGDGLTGILVQYVQSGTTTSISATIGTAVSQGPNVRPDVARTAIDALLTADLLLNSTLESDDVTPGERVTYRMRVRNVGSLDVPAGAQLVYNMGTGLSLTQFTCSPSPLNRCTVAPAFPAPSSSIALPSIPAGGEYALLVTALVSAPAGATITMTSEVLVPSGYRDLTPNDNRIVVGPTPVRTWPDLSLTKTALGRFRAGDTASYQLTVRNVGLESTMAPIELADPLSSSLRFQGATGAGWNCSALEQLVTCTQVAALGSGDSSSVTLRVAIARSAQGAISNSAHVRTRGDLRLRNDTSTITTPLVVGPDLSLRQSVDTDTLKLGGTATYTLTVTNDGNAASTAEVELQDTLPEGLKPIATSGDDLACTITGQRVTCSRNAALDVGATASVAITVQVSAALPLEPITNTACVRTSDDLQPANDCSSVTTLTAVRRQATLRKEALGAFIVGQTGRFRIWVTNIGSAPLTGPIVVLDSLPAGMTYTTAGGDGWRCTYRQSLVQCTGAGPIPAGDSSSFVLEASIGVDALGATATVCSALRLGEGAELATNGRSCDPVRAVADYRLALELTTSRYLRDVGDVPDFTVLVRNIGQSPLPGVVVTNQLPRGFRYVPGSSTRGGRPDTRSREALSDPRIGDGATLEWSLGEVAPGQTIRVEYRAQIGAGVSFTNNNVTQSTATSGTPGGAVPSNTATAPIRVQRDLFDNRGMIAGKVYAQCDCADVAGQRDGDLGIPGVRVIMEDGTGAVTDAEGKYNFLNVRAGLHVVKVDRSTLPAGATLVVLNTRNAGDAGSRFVDLKAGELHRADFAEGSRSAAVLDDVRERRRVSDVGQAGESGRLAASPLTPLTFTPRATTPLPTAPTSTSVYQPLVLPNALRDGQTALPMSPARAAASGTAWPGDPAVDSGPASHHVASADLRGPHTEAALRPMMAAGLLQGRIDVRQLSRGALRVSGASSLFDDPLHDLSVSDDSGRVHAAARGALLLKGDVKGAGRLTLSFDSERDRDRTQFRDITPDQGFPIFGDASWREFDAQSQQRLYARLDRGASSIRYGDFATPRSDASRLLLAYDRSLTGLTYHAESQRGVVNGFVSRNGIRQSVDELPGRGVSGPYYLTKSNALVNSERVEIVTRDRNQPAVILRTQSMARFEEYTVEPVTGRVLFRVPVPSMDASLNPVSIRVSYEVTQGADQFNTYGGDGRLRVGTRLELGGFAVRDDNPLEAQTLLGATATAVLGASTTVVGEVARTETGEQDVQGDAWRIELRHQSARLEGRVFAMQSDSAFANRSSTFMGGRVELGARWNAQLRANTRLLAEALHTADTRTEGRRDGALLAIEQRLLPGLVGELGYRWANENGASVTPLLGAQTGADAGAHGLFGRNGTDLTRNLTPAAFNAARARLTARVPGNARSSVFAEYEYGVDNASARRGAIGGEYLLIDKTRLYLRHEWLSSTQGPYGLSEDRSQQNTVFGITADYLRNGQLFSEYRARDAFNGHDAEASIGLRNRWRLAPGVLANTTFERVAPLAGAETGRAFAATGALEWTSAANWKGTSRIEWRTTPAGDHVLGSLGYARKLSRDWTMLGRTLWDQMPTSQLRGRSQVGFAWRQTDQNRINALFRLENRLDRTDALGAPTSRTTANVAAFLLNLQPVPTLTLSTRLAGKMSADTRDGVTSRATAQLLMGRAIVDLSTRFDLGLIGSTLGSANFGERQYGLGMEFGVVLMRNLRLAGGYNLFGFTDRDFALLGHTQRGPYLEFGLKFDERLFNKK
jgi:uncharacterized repeat protein (TIGR01451 family)